MFSNTRTGSKSRELGAYQTESEAEAKTRLESAGWDLADAKFDENKKMFVIEEAEEEDEGDKA